MEKKELTGNSEILLYQGTDGKFRLEARLGNGSAIKDSLIAATSSKTYNAKCFVEVVQELKRLEKRDKKDR